MENYCRAKFEKKKKLTNWLTSRIRTKRYTITVTLQDLWLITSHHGYRRGVISPIHNDLMNAHIIYSNPLSVWNEICKDEVLLVSMRWASVSWVELTGSLSISLLFVQPLTTREGPGAVASHVDDLYVVEEPSRAPPTVVMLNADLCQVTYKVQKAEELPWRKDSRALV